MIKLEKEKLNRKLDITNKNIKSKSGYDIKYGFFKSIVAFNLALCISTSSVISYAANIYDESALLVPVVNKYTGRDDAGSILKTIGFSDVANNHWAKEAIARAGALELVRGFDNLYYPNKNVTRAESLGLMIRLLGRDEEAKELTNTISSSWADDVSMQHLWAIGHMSIAKDLGIISELDYQDALFADQDALRESKNFVMGLGATREEIAQYISKVLQIMAPDKIFYNDAYPELYRFSDYNQIDPHLRADVDLVVKYKIMQGTDVGTFEPKKRVLRTEMAQILKNLDEYYYTYAGITKKMGYVSEIQKDIYVVNDEDTRGINTYVRLQDGTTDLIYTTSSKNNIGQVSRNEVIVYKDNVVSTMSLLEKGDKVEFLVDSNGKVLYVSAESTKDEYIYGSLYSLKEINDYKLTIKLDDGRFYDGTVKDYLYDSKNKKILIGDTWYSTTNLPMYNRYQLVVRGDVIKEIVPVGEEELFDEYRGIVKDIDLFKKELTFYDLNQNELTFKWTENTDVEKKEYYDSSDEIGYIDEVFKEYMYDSMDSSTDNIEIGDTVFVRLNEDGTIKKIDVGTNYGIKYGKVTHIDYQGVEGSRLTLKYENETSEMLDVASDVIVKKNNRKVTLSSIVVGDWIRVLYNRGIISEDLVIETVKQINVSGVEDQIENIYKGELMYVDTYQNELNFADVETLRSNGWREYQTIKTMKISPDAIFYDESKRVSLDYVKEFMQKYGTAYIATEEDFGQEQIIQVTFRDSRETVLNQDNINYAKGNGELKLTYDPTSIMADDGTIIRRYGRMVDKEAVMVPDLAKIILNGNRSAAVIDIIEEVSNDELCVYRGKIKSITQSTSFEVASFSKLMDMTWSYMPLNRNFIINSKTKIYQGGEVVPYYDFIDYTDKSQLDNVYTIFATGDEALVLSDMPYTKLGVTGTVYAKDGDTYNLMDVVSYDDKTSAWVEISANDRTIPVNKIESTIIVKSGEIVGSNAIKVGDKLRVIGIQDGYEVRRSGGSYDAYIIFIEK